MVATDSIDYNRRFRRNRAALRVSTLSRHLVEMGASQSNPRGDLKEYSVVYTDRAVNLMSSPFQKVMRDISGTLKKVYKCEHCVLIPGSGTYAMEACARQFATNKKAMVLRNGYFSFRWSDIFEVCGIPATELVMKARPTEDHPNPQFAPFPLEDLLAKIKEEKPAAFFAPHVETSTGMILPDSYIKAVADAVHAVNGVFVLDCIASGTQWVDMEATGVDALISAPQKGWSGPACVGIVMMNERAKKLVDSEKPTSFCCNLKKWDEVMKKYEAGAFMYYTTLPTDSLTKFRDVMIETEEYGFEKCREGMKELGAKIRAVLEKRGYKSVAHDDFKACSVVVSYADKNLVPDFKGEGLMIAGGVPFKLDEPQGLNTFRLGLFGLDKIYDIPKTVRIFEQALDGIIAKAAVA